MKRATFAALAVLVTAFNASAEIKTDQISRLAAAAQVIRETRPSIPQEYWDRARCVAVVPDLIKAAFVIGGEWGKGVVSCRAGDDWSAPLFIQLAKGSWGFQAGAEQIDVVMLVMNESGVQKLLQNKVALGADASVAAGPIGRQGQIGTDATLSAEVVAYSRARGLFAGINLSGGVLRPDEEANGEVYGTGASPATVLATRALSAPTQATAFLAALGTASTAAAAPVKAPPREPAAPLAVSATTDADLRAQVVALQQTLDRLLSDGNGSVVGTAGSAGDARATVTVSRERLEQMRAQIDRLLTALQGR